ncbi:tRNA (adenosine(37)-N6)-threonylcarbamoyltransferase complex ATPase subunit type 1 TsaE [Gleimia sp. 6138-11-ORH1]|uniref:tRNA (adenosine(37)-N6)-threonylcarbamoyltransferase complex ATPase subunit type 1 TsaE n=1 Tax=Gleimia sp. 6138-11-ORH1 TaxID=2973937 RepID=UPI002167A42B|nr:tRNA (adenosine(37)-N6)-threonylcarbamoyltransferase complex ATPase subunit type 1 TsaE [Gleimia sp. 6138-11-ORH1]MCS4484576.1 tRNA (adenosine(37)-N6)-threonylcarbamoyltransferase complex ATPase subunit type 1 TsaE [Gleimia sp. 6138-11-ORH1]
MFELKVDSPELTQAIGYALGTLVRGGDLLMLSGDLGAGKTTFTQGLGRGMNVAGRVASPTFIISRVHAGQVNQAGVKGPDLVHVDAYRITDLDDLETLDLDTLLTEAVVVVEWGEGKTESLSEHRLEITIRAEVLEPQVDTEETVNLENIDTGKRVIRFKPIGSRWDEAVLAETLSQALQAAQEEN